MTGYYRMHRGWLVHPVLGGEPMCKRAAWAWLIEEASWSHRRRDIKGKTIELHRGQLTASVRFLAKAWGWHRARVERFLGRLQTETMIETATDSGQLVITICNYERYQKIAPGGETEVETPIETGARQERDKREGRKERKEKKKNHTAGGNGNGLGESISAAPNDDPFEAFWTAYPSRAPHSNPRKPAQAEFDRAIKRGVDAAAIVRGSKNYSEIVSQLRTEPQFVAQARTWLHQERWMEYQRGPEPAKTRSKEFVP